MCVLTQLAVPQLQPLCMAVLESHYIVDKTERPMYTACVVNCVPEKLALIEKHKEARSKGQCKP